MANVNHYHPTTYFYTHTTQAEPDPMEPDRWLVPAFSSMKSLQPERDGLVNRYNPETKAFELTEPPAPVVEQPIRPQLPTQSNWMVEIAKRPAKIITEGTSFCNYVCANAGFTDLAQLEALAEQFASGNTSELAERANRFMNWRVECLGAVSDLAAGLRADAAVYPPSMSDMIFALPKPPGIEPPGEHVEPEPTPAAAEQLSDGQ